LAEDRMNREALAETEQVLADPQFKDVPFASVILDHIGDAVAKEPGFEEMTAAEYKTEVLKRFKEAYPAKPAPKPEPKEDVVVPKPAAALVSPGGPARSGEDGGEEDPAGIDQSTPAGRAKWKAYKAKRRMPV
jgi:hypothetical protein